MSKEVLIKRGTEKYILFCLHNNNNNKKKYPAVCQNIQYFVYGDNNFVSNEIVLTDTATLYL